MPVRGRKVNTVSPPSVVCSATMEAMPATLSEKVDATCAEVQWVPGRVKVWLVVAITTRVCAIFYFLI